jgi:hypothetical protein
MPVARSDAIGEGGVGVGLETGEEGSLSETTGTSTSMALPMVPSRTPAKVSALTAIATVAVPRIPAMVSTVMSEDFISSDYKPSTQKNPFEIQGLSKVSQGLLLSGFRGNGFCG